MLFCGSSPIDGYFSSDDTQILIILSSYCKVQKLKVFLFGLPITAGKFEGVAIEQ